jgi:hypothetical protein
MQKISVLEINRVLTVEMNISVCESMKYSFDVHVVTGLIMAECLRTGCLELFDLRGRRQKEAGKNL